MIEGRTPTTGAEAPSDAARTSSGRPHSNRSGDAQQVLLNRGNFEASGDGWPVGNNGSHVLTIVNHISYWLGTARWPSIMSSDKNDSGRLLAQPKPGKLFFFLSLFHDADRRATKRLLHRVQHDAVEWRKRTSTSVSFVVQLARGEGTRRPGTGAPPKRSWRGPEEKWRPGETCAHSTMESWSIRRSCPAWWKELGFGTGELRTALAGPSLNMLTWTENDLDVDLGTCGCVDHRQNFGPQSVESINTSAAHILARVNLKLGRVLTTSQKPQPGNWRCHMADWNQSIGAMEYGTQVATATPASCLEFAASFSMGNRLLAQRLPVPRNYRSPYTLDLEKKLTSACIGLLGRRGL